MDSPDPLRRTPLFDAHLRAGARMVPFGGWEMPVEYSGLIAEHMAVRTAAGLFDVSHMGEFEVEGAGALAFLQRVTSNNVAKLVDGRAQYSALPMPNGCPVDDIIVFRRAEDRSDDFALLALQGPEAQAILAPLTPLDLDQIAYYRFAEGPVDGRPASVSRTGYTGEDGFEILVPAAEGEALWDRLLAAGKGSGLVPAGLGARDTLRLEARMCLYGNDMDETTTLVEAGLGWIVSIDAAKGDFLGREVLAKQKADGAPRKLVGFEMVGRGIGRHGYPVWLDGQHVGEVTSGTHAPFLKKAIGLTYLPRARAEVGTEIAIEIRGQRIAARVVPTPFYKRQPA